MLYEFWYIFYIVQFKLCEFSTDSHLCLKFSAKWRYCLASSKIHLTGFNYIQVDLYKSSHKYYARRNALLGKVVLRRSVFVNLWPNYVFGLILIIPPDESW